MKKFLSIILATLILSFAPGADAQKAKISQIVREKADGEVNGCGIEVVATDGKANGIQLQAILYSLGNLNWNLTMHIIAGNVNDQNEFTQQEVINASILGKGFDEINLVKNNKYVAPESLEKMYVVGIIRQMLLSGFSISFQTNNEFGGYIEVPKSDEQFKIYTDGCYAEMAGMLREHYRKIHGDTKCLDKPESC